MISLQIIIPDPLSECFPCIRMVRACYAEIQLALFTVQGRNEVDKLLSTSTLITNVNSIVSCAVHIILATIHPYKLFFVILTEYFVINLVKERTCLIGSIVSDVFSIVRGINLVIDRGSRRILLLLSFKVSDSRT